LLPSGFIGHARAVSQLRAGCRAAIDDATVRRLTKEAVALNKKLGDPTEAAT
jgi:hypothetical protein